MVVREERSLRKGVPAELLQRFDKQMDHKAPPNNEKRRRRERRAREGRNLIAAWWGSQTIINTQTALARLYGCQREMHTRSVFDTAVWRKSGLQLMLYMYHMNRTSTGPFLLSFDTICLRGTFFFKERKSEWLCMHVHVCVRVPARER